MKTKEKAEELFEKYDNEVAYDDDYSSHTEQIKRCVLITVDELIEAFKQLSIEESGRVNVDFGHGYWEEVRREVERL